MYGPALTNQTESNIDYKNTVFYPILDALLDELKRRFSEDSLSIASGVAAVLKATYGNPNLYLLERYSESLKFDSLLSQMLNSNLFNMRPL